jgi:1-acyl-sn-glycerol-3-phosphate acyltransferase
MGTGLPCQGGAATIRGVSQGFADEQPKYARVRVGPIALLRAIVRLPLLLVVTLGAAFIWGLLALWPWRRAGRVALRRGVSRRWAAAMCRVLGARIELLGDLPQGPGFLITNHVGYLDIPVLMSLTGCRFVSKHEIAGWPLIGFLARKAGTLFVKRGNGGRDAGVTLEGMARALEDGDLVVFFPEGTTSTGERVLPFRSGLLSLPARDGHPVWPAALAYESGDPEFDPGLGLAWSGKQSPLKHVWRLACTPGFTVRIAVAHAVEAGHRKHLAQALHHRVAMMHAGLSHGDAAGIDALAGPAGEPPGQGRKRA